MVPEVRHGCEPKPISHGLRQLRALDAKVKEPAIVVHSVTIPCYHRESKSGTWIGGTMAAVELDEKLLPLL